MARSWWQQLSASSKRHDVRARKRPRLTIDTLEARITPAPTPLTYTSPGPSSLTLVMNGADLQIVDGTNTVVASRPLADTSGVVITGAAGATETLLVDYESGGFFAPTDGVQFNAGTGGTDALTVRGDATNVATTAVFTPAAVGGGAVAVTIGGVTTKVTATGLESPVAVTNATALTYRSPGPTNVLTVDSPVSGANRVSGTSGGSAVHPLTFSNVPAVTVDTATNDGDPSRDAVTLAAPGFRASGLQNFTVDTGYDVDVLTIGADDLALPSGGGAFKFDGGTEADTVVWNRGADTQDLDITLTNSRLSVADAGGVNLASVDAASLTGGAGNDGFDARSWFGRATVAGGLGRDTLRTSGGLVGHVSATAAGSAGNYTLTLDPDNSSGQPEYTVSSTERVLVEDLLENETIGVAQQAEMIAGIQSVAVFVGNLAQVEELGRPLPVTDANLTALAGLRGAINKIAADLNGYLNRLRASSGGGQDVFTSDVTGFLKGTSGATAPFDTMPSFTMTDSYGTVTATVSGVRIDVLVNPDGNTRPMVHLSVDTSRTSNLSLGSAQLSSDLGLTFKAGGSGSVNLATTSRLDFAFDLARGAADKVRVDLDRLRVTAAANNQAVTNAPAAIGFLGVRASGTIVLNAEVPVLFVDPTPDDGTKPSDINPNPPPMPAQYTPAFVHRDAMGRLPDVNHTYSATFDTTVDDGIKFFDTSVGPAEVPKTQYAGKVVIGSTEFLVGPLSIEFLKADGVTPHPELRNFTYLAPEAALGMLQQLQAFLGEIGGSAVLKKDVPFAAPIDVQVSDANGRVVRKSLANLGDVLDFGRAFQQDVSQWITEASLLAGSTVSGVTPGVLAADNSFVLEINGRSVPVTVASSATTGNTSVAELATDVQTAITNALGAAGVSGVTAFVTDSYGALRITLRGVLGFGLTADADPLKNQLGFGTSARSTPAPLFMDAQGLAALIGQGLSAATGNTVTVTPKYDAHDTVDADGRPRGNELTFRLDWSHTFPDVKLPVDFGTALGDFSGITGAPSVLVQSSAPGQYVVHFTNALGRRDVSPLTIDTSKLTGGTGSVAETVKGTATRDETQTVTVTATGGTFTLTFNGQTTDPLPYNATALAVQQALAGLPGVRELGALPVSATTTLGLTFGVELTATPQANLGLIPATTTGPAVDPDMIITAPLVTRPVTPVPLSDAAASSTLLVNGRRLDFHVPAANAAHVRLDATSPAQLSLLLFGYPAMGFTLEVDGTDVPVTLPSATIFDVIFSGNPSGRLLRELNDAVANGLSAAGKSANPVQVTLTADARLRFDATASSLKVKTPDGSAQVYLGLTDGLTAGSLPPPAPTLIAERPVSTPVPGELSSDAAFTLTVGGTDLNVTVRKKDTLGNRSPLDALVTDVQAAVDTALGITDPADPKRVRVFLDAGGRLQFAAPTAPAGTAAGVSITVTNDVARDQLGLGFSQSRAGALGGSVQMSAERPVVTTSPGQLREDATFSLSINGGTAVAVTVRRAVTFDNTSPLDGLLADVQAAVTRASTASTRVTVSRIGQTLVFLGPPTAGGETALLSIGSAVGDPAVTELGLGVSQAGTSQADARRVARVQAALDGQLVNLGLSPGDVVVRPEDGKLTYSPSGPAVFDVQAPAEVLAPTPTPRTGVFRPPMQFGEHPAHPSDPTDAHFHLVLNDMDMVPVTVMKDPMNADRLPSLTGEAVGATIVHDGEFTLTVVRGAGSDPMDWQTVVRRVTLRAADAVALLGFGGRKSEPGVIVADTALGSVLTADSTFRISFDTTDPGAPSPGGDPVDVTVFAAETADNLSPRDLVADLNAALARSGQGDRAFASLDPAGRLKFTAVDPNTGAADPTRWVTISRVPLTVGSGPNAELETGLQGAVDAALAGAGFAAGAVQVTVSATRQVTLAATAGNDIRALKVNVAPADPDVARQTTGLGLRNGDADSPIRALAEDVQTAVNDALVAHGYDADDVRVYTLGDVSADTSRLVLGAARRGASPIVSMRVIAKRNDPAVLQLGFDDLNPVTTARPVELAARARSDNFFLRSTTLAGSLTAAKTDLPVAGTYGFVGFDGTADINVGATASLALVNPAGQYPRLKLGDLRTAVAEGTLGDPATAAVTTGGSATAELTLVPGGNLLGPDELHAAFTVGNWAADDTAVSVEATAAKLKDLYLFRSLRLPAVLTALHQVADYLRGLDDPRLDAALPLVNQSVRELLDYAGRFDDFITAVGTVPTPNLQAMAALVKGALGFPLDSDAVTFRMDNSVANKPALRLDLLFQTGGIQSYSLDLDVEQLFGLSGSPEALDDIKRVLQGNSGTEVPYLRLTAMNSGGKIDAGAMATLRLSLGFDLATPATAGLDVTVPRAVTVATVSADGPFAPTAAGELAGDSTFFLTVTGPRTDSGTATVRVPVTVTQAMTAGAADSTALAARIQEQINAALRAELGKSSVVQDPLDPNAGPPRFLVGDVIVGTRDVTVNEGGLPSISAAATAAGVVTAGRGIDLTFIRALAARNVGEIGLDGSALVKQSTDPSGAVIDGVASLTLSTVQDGQGSPTALNEIQRLVIDATGGSFTLRFNGNETDPLPFNASADVIAKALAALPDLAAPAHAWKVTFTGAHRRQAIPDALTADVSALFTADGSAPVVRFETFLPGSSTTDEVRFIQADAVGGTFTLTFRGQTTAPIPFDATGEQVAAALGAVVGGDTIKIYARTDTVTAIHVDADADDPLVTQLHFTGNDDANARVVIAGTAFDARTPGTLRGDAVFTLEIGRAGSTMPTVVDVVVRQADTLGLTDVSQVVQKVQQALDVGLGMAAGDLVVQIGEGGVLTLSADAAADIRSVRLMSPVENPARAELGLGAVQQSGTGGTAVVTAPTAVATQRPGILSSPATFDLRLTDGVGTVSLAVRVDPDGNNLGTDDLILDIQAVVGVALVAAGRIATDVTVGLTLDGKLTFTGVAGVAALRITATGGNPVQTQLGFVGDQIGDQGNLGLDDLRRDVQAAVDSALATTPGFRPGDVLVGVQTTITGGTIRFGRRGELGFGPVQEASRTAADPAVVQAFAAINTPRSGVLSAAATFDLKVTRTTGSPVTVVVSVPVDTTNTRTADLVADIQSALNARLAAAGIAGTVTVGIVPSEFTAPGVARDNYLTLTGGPTVTALMVTTPTLPPAVDVPGSGRLVEDLVLTVGLPASSPSLEPFLYDGPPATAAGLQVGGTELKVEAKLVSQGPGARVTGSGTAADPFLVTFINGFGMQDVPLLGVDSTGVLATPTTLGDVNIEVVQEGSDSQNEVQKITLVNANSGFFVLAFQGETTAPITLPTNAGKVEQALIGLDNLGAAFTALIGPVAFKARRAEALLDADGFSDTTAAASYTLNLTNTSNTTAAVTVDPYTTQATLVGGGLLPANGRLGSAATFDLDVVRASQPGTVLRVTVSVAADVTNATRDHLVADVQAALDAALAAGGLAVGEVVASLTSGNRLRLSGGPRDGTLTLAVANLQGSAAGGLGLGGATATTGNQARPVLGGAQPVSAPNGVLASKATFTLILNKAGNPLAPIVVDVNRDTTNTTFAALAADVQTALNPLLVARGFVAGDIAVGLTAGNVLTLTARPASDITALRVTTGETNTARTQLGLPADAVSASDNGLTDLVPDVQAAVDGAVGVNKVVVGFVPSTLKLTFTPKAGSGLVAVKVVGGSAALALPGNGQLAQPLALTLLLGTGATGDGRHALGSPAEAVADTSLAVRGGMSLDLPLFNVNADETAGGLALHLPDLDAFFKTQDPVAPTPLAGNQKVTFTNVPDFSQAEVPIPITSPDDAERALIDDPGVILDGLEGYFDGMQGQVDDQAASGQLPLLGDAAKGPLQFVSDLKTAVLTKMKDTWSRLLSAPDPVVSIPVPMTPGNYVTITPDKDSFVNPPDRTIDLVNYVSEIIPNDGQAILVENWGHLGRSLSPFTTLKNTLYNLFGPTPERVKEFYGVVESRDTVTVGVTWDETQGLHGEPKYTTRQQLLDKYQEHMNDELAKIGYYQIDGQATVLAEFGPTAEAGDPFYRFTPVVPTNGWTEDQLNGTWNVANSLLHLKGLTSTMVAGKAVLTGSAAVYSGIPPQGILGGGFGPVNLAVTSDNYDEPVNLFLDLSERGALANDLQSAIDDALAAWAVANPTRADYADSLSVGINSLGRITITAGDESDATFARLAVAPGAGTGAAALGFTAARTVDRIRMSNTAYPAAVAGSSPARRDGLLTGAADFTITLTPTDQSGDVVLNVAVQPRTAGDTAALVDYVQSVVDGALDDAGKAALGAGDITVGLATGRLTFTGSTEARVTELKTAIPTRYKVVSSSVILGTTDYTPTPVTGVIDKGFDLELELWINTPAPASVFQVAPLRTGKQGTTDVKVTAGIAASNTWTLEFTGPYVGSPPAVEVRSNEANPLMTVATDATTGEKTLVPGSVTYTPNASGGVLTVLADEGGFDIIVTLKDGTKFETSVAGGDYEEGIEAGAAVDDLAAALAGPNTAAEGAENLLRRKAGVTEADTGVAVLSEPPPTTDDVEVATDVFKVHEFGVKKGLPVVPFKLVDNPTISVGFRLGEQNLLARFAKKAAAEAEGDPTKVNADGEILLGGGVRLIPDVPGVGTALVLPKLSAESSGFGVELNAGLAARIGWEANIGFGVSKKEIFFLDTAKQDELKLELRLGLAGNELDAPASFHVKLGPFVGTATDQFPTAPYSTFLMDLNLTRYRVPVPVTNYKGNSLLAYTGTDSSHPEDLLTDLNSALKGFLPTLGFKTDDVVAVFTPLSLDDLQDQLSAALGKAVSLGEVSVAAVAGTTNQFDVTFNGGRLAGSDVSQLTADTTALADSSKPNGLNPGTGTVTVTTTTAGAAGVNEVQRITVTGDAGEFFLIFDGKKTVGLDHDATAAEIAAALNALPNMRGMPDALPDDAGALVPLTLAQKALARTVFASQFELTPNRDPNHVFRQRIFAVGLVPAGLQLDPKLNGKLLPDREDGDPSTAAPFPQNALFQDDPDLLPTSLVFSIGVDIRDPDKNIAVTIPVAPDGLLKNDVTFDLVVKKTTAIKGVNAGLIANPSENYKLPGIKLEKKYTDGQGAPGASTPAQMKPNRSPADLAKDIQEAIDRYLNGPKPAGLNDSQWSAIKQAVQPGDIAVTFDDKKSLQFKFAAAAGGADPVAAARRANIREVQVDADGERLSAQELFRYKFDAFRVTAKGNLNVNAKLELSFKGVTEEDANPLLPKISIDLAVDKPLFQFDTDLRTKNVPVGGPVKGSVPLPVPSNGRLEDDLDFILILNGENKWPVRVLERDTYTPKKNASDPDRATDNQDVYDLRDDIQRAIDNVLFKRGVKERAVLVEFDRKLNQFLIKKNAAVQSRVTSVTYQVKQGSTKLRNVSIDLGSFIGDLAGPILRKVGEIVKPFDWLIGDEGLLTRRLPVLSDLAGRSTSLLDLAGQFGTNKTAKALGALREMRTSVKSVEAATKDAKGSTLPLGTIRLDGTGNGYQQLQGSAANGANRTGTAANGSAPVDKPGPAKNFFANTQRGSFNLGFPILTEPRLLLDALSIQGKFKDLTLVTLGLPHFEFNFQYEQRFQVFGPLFVTLGGFFSAAIDIGVGFDMSGVARYEQTGQVIDIFDGFFISDRTNPNGSGADRPELSFTGGITAGAELNLGVASAGVQGGITATVDFNLDDPNNDGRVRLSEMIQNIKANDNNPAAIFDIGGRIGWFFRAYVEALGGLFRYSKDLGAGTLFEFSVPFKRLPVLALAQSGGLLTLNTGALAANRIHGSVDGNAGDNFRIDSQSANNDGSLNLLVRMGNAEVSYANVRVLEATGGAGNDTYDFRGVTAVGLTVNAAGGGGDDTMYAGEGTYTFLGDDGNDILVGGAGNDLFDGGAGDDSVSGAGGNDSVTGGDGNDTVAGGDGKNTIDGGAGEDSLSAGAGNDAYVLNDGWGDDTVTDGGGLDAFDMRATTVALTFRVSDNAGVQQTAVTDFTSRAVAFDFGIELLLGGRGADRYNVAAAGANGLILDGGRGSDMYVYDLATLATAPLIRDTGPIWNTDTLILNATADRERFDLDPTTMTVQNLTAGTPKVGIAYTGGGIEALEANGKAGADVINVSGTDPRMRYTVNAGEGDDTVNIGVDLLTGLPTDLRQMRGEADVGPLLVRGNGGKDAINVYDTNDARDIAGTLTPNRVLGLGMRVGIKYLSFEDMHLALGSGDNRFTVEGTHASQRGIAGIPASQVVRTTTINAGDGADELLVKTIGGDTTVRGQGGDDTFYVADDLTTTDQIFGTLTVDGGASTTRDVLTVDDSEDRSPNTGELTSTSITGLDMGGRIDYAGMEELHLDLGQRPDAFNVRSTLNVTPVSLTGGGGDDIITVANTSQSLFDIRGGLDIDAGEGVNQLIADNRGSTGSAGMRNSVVTDDEIIAFAPVSIFYRATNGSFDSPTNSPAKGTGVMLRGSAAGRDAFFVQSTLAGSTTAVEGNGGNDVYYVGALPAVPVVDGPDVFPVAGNITDNGNLDEIRGRLHVISAHPVVGGRLYVNDHGYAARANYTVGGGVVQEFIDPTNPAPVRAGFAGIDFDAAIKQLRLDATDDVNVFDAKPSLTTQMLVSANLPVGGVPIVGGGDYLRLDTAKTKGRRLFITSPGNGYWKFTSKHLPLTFESIERFNHVGIVGYNGDVGKRSPAPYVTVRDAENGVLKFAKMTYAGTFRGGVRYAMADMNYDGLPDLVTVSGPGRTAEVHVYDGSPNALGKYPGKLLTSFPVLPLNVKTGAFIALGDVNYDGANDIVIGADAGWVPQVSVWDGRTALTTHDELVNPYLAYPATFRGGVRVAVGDLDTTDGASTSAGRAEIVTGTGKGTAPTVGIFGLDAAGQIAERPRFYGFPATMITSGIYVAVGDYNGDKVRDVIVTPGPGVAPRMNIFSGKGLMTRSGLAETPTWSIPVKPLSYRGGLSVVPVPKGGGNPGAVEWVDLRVVLGPR